MLKGIDCQASYHKQESLPQLGEETPYHRPDILVSAEAKEDCEKASIVVCNVLAQARFKASKEKLQWDQPKVTYLGYILVPEQPNHLFVPDQSVRIKSLKPTRRGEMKYLKPATVTSVTKTRVLTDYQPQWIHASRLKYCSSGGQESSNSK
ncbi:hypothetical protein QQF64_014839 [Cirrhinus molitorella]|uniref:Murine leukemia virus integrase C-terminal domain-containing protein n=1 Tax=Cirrhinus molitorella TaxID=172907 RepID=A0ABR3NTI0_9TELE